MRVLLASRIFSPEPAAASFRLAALADSLDAAGHSVTVLTTTVPGNLQATTRPGVAVKRFPVLRDAAGYVRGYLQYMSFDIPLFFRLLTARRPGVVVVEPPPTTALAVRVVCVLRRIPFVYYAADVWSDAAEATGAPKAVVAALRFVERLVLSGARSVVAVSDGVAARVAELAPRARVSVVSNGIDTDVFSPDGARHPAPPLAVYAGTTSEWQGAEIFVRAMPAVIEHIPDARLLFLGQGSAWSGLAQLADTLGLDSVEFRDVAPPAEAAAWLRSARVSVVSLTPGQGYDFAVPTKIFAAVACGTPVVFTGPQDGPAAALVRDSGLGESVPYDPAAVGESLIAALRHPVADEKRLALSLWAEQNVSVARTASRAASIVIAAGSSPRG